MPTAQPGTVTLGALSAGGFSAPCEPCSIGESVVGGFLYGVTLGYSGTPCACASPTAPSASGSFFTDPVGHVSDAAGRVATDVGNALADPINAAGNAAKKATPAILAVSVGIVAVAVAIIYVAHRV